MKLLPLTGSLFALILLSSTIEARPVPGKNTRVYVSRFENVLGTSMELKISAVSPAAATAAENAALHEIARLSKILSAYDADSEFSRWFKTGQQPVQVEGAI
jgi:FAD:protein FMN transferase